MIPSNAAIELARSYLAEEWRKQFGDVDPKRYLCSSEALNASEELTRLERVPEVHSSQLAACYDRMAEEYIVHHATDMDTFSRQMAYQLERLWAEKPKTVIVGACGTCIPSGFLARTLPDVRFLGYDLSKKSLSVAEQRLHRLGVKNMRLTWTEHCRAQFDIRTRGQVILCQLGYLDPNWIPELCPLLEDGGALIVIANIAEWDTETYSHYAMHGQLREETAERQRFPYTDTDELFARLIAQNNDPRAKLGIASLHPRLGIATDVLSYRKRSS